MGNLANLEYLELYGNQLSGQFPHFLRWSVPHDHLVFADFCFPIHLIFNPLALFLFIPRRCTSSKGFPGETPAQLRHLRLRFTKSAAKTQIDIFLGWTAFHPQNPRVTLIVFCLCSYGLLLHARVPVGCAFMGSVVPGSPNCTCCTSTTCAYMCM